MSTSARARAWHHAAQARVCDVARPWAHGTILRATRYPGYWDYNVVRVEEDPPMEAEELAAFADEALAGLEHRRIDLEPADAAERLRASSRYSAGLPSAWSGCATRRPPHPDRQLPSRRFPTTM